jgi:hypothetical protein
MQFFSVLDAMHGAAMFKHVAASPWVDYLIMSSNFKVRPIRALGFRVATFRV